MHSTDRMTSGGCSGRAVVIAVFPEGCLTAGSIVSLAAFNAENC
jgi:hypothetical protein